MLTRVLKRAAALVIPRQPSLPHGGDTRRIGCDGDRLPAPGSGTRSAEPDTTRQNPTSPQAHCGILPWAGSRKRRHIAARLPFHLP